VSETLSGKLKKRFIKSQRQELTEHIVYARLADLAKDEKNKEILKQLSEDELRHYKAWKQLTNAEPKQKSFKIWRYVLISRLFGLTFGLKLMERGEKNAEKSYGKVSEQVPAALEMSKDEGRHEKQLLELIDEEKLKYVSSVVLGLNDALVEFTGALAGFTFALQDARLVGMTGLITGIAASLSMGTSEYLSTKSEGGDKSPRKASMYTTSAYFTTVFVLIMPFVLLENIYLSLALSISSGILIIFVFTFYISVAKDLSFRKRFLETASISLGVAGLTFMLGLLVRILFGVQI